MTRAMTRTNTDLWIRPFNMDFNDILLKKKKKKSLKDTEMKDLHH